MAPLPPESTVRLKCEYTGPFGTHTMEFRATSGATPSAFRDEVQVVVTAMAACQWAGTTWGATELAAEGSTIFIPQPAFNINSSYPVGPETTSSPSAFLQWGGRSAGGRRVKFYLFEIHLPPRNDMRYQAGENATVDSVTNALVGSTLIAAIDGLEPVWKTYANVGQNDYLTHKARG